MDDPMLFTVQGITAIYGISKNVEQTTKCFISNRNLDTASGSCYFSVSLQALAGSQHDAAYDIISKVLGHLHNASLTVVLDFKGILNIRKLSVFKNNVYNRSHNLYDLTFIHSHHFLFCALAPLITSVISWVIAA